MSTTKQLMKTFDGLQTADFGEDGDAVRAKVFFRSVSIVFPMNLYITLISIAALPLRNSSAFSSYLSQGGC